MTQPKSLLDPFDIFRGLASRLERGLELAVVPPFLLMADRLREDASRRVSERVEHHRHVGGDAVAPVLKAKRRAQELLLVSHGGRLPGLRHENADGVGVDEEDAGRPHHLGRLGLGRRGFGEEGGRQHDGRDEALESVSEHDAVILPVSTEPMPCWGARLP